MELQIFKRGISQFSHFANNSVMHGLNGIVKSLNCFPTLQEKLSIVFFCQFPKLTEVVSMFLVSFSVADAENGRQVVRRRKSGKRCVS